MTDEKALEYQQIAALVCLDLDILKDIAENRHMDAEQLKKMIVHIWKKKEKLISDKEHRESRFNAGCAIWSLPRAKP